MMRCPQCGHEYYLTVPSSTNSVQEDLPEHLKDLRYLDSCLGPVWWGVVDKDLDKPESRSLRYLLESGLAQIKDGGLVITKQGRAELYKPESQRLLTLGGYTKPLEKHTPVRNRVRNRKPRNV